MSQSDLSVGGGNRNISGGGAGRLPPPSVRPVRGGVYDAEFSVSASMDMGADAIEVGGLSH